MRLSDLRDRNVAVWGTGREGVAAVKAIAPFKPKRLSVVQDRKTAHATDWSRDLAEIAPLYTGDDAHRELLAAHVVVRSPVIGQTHPWIVELRARGTVITGGTALWMAEHAGRTIAVTGSKGKSTTTTLIHHLLGALGRPSALGGNIGTPVLTLPESDQYVIELSAYQCADLQDSPHVVALTALFPEHLDWSGSEAAYYRDKLNIVAHGVGTVVYNQSDERLAGELHRYGTDLPLLASGGPDGFHVRPGQSGELLVYLADKPLFPRSALPLLGRHNGNNLCVALAVLSAVGVDCVAERQQIGNALSTYEALPHRLTPIPDSSGITFVDDSLSTAPESAIYAMEAYIGQPLTVILGGEDRGLDYSPLRAFLIDRQIVATIIGIPDSGPRILEALGGVDALTLISSDSLTHAVRLARVHTPDGGVVILSPAAPSYGKFDNFEHRSNVFRQAIEESRA